VLLGGFRPVTLVLSPVAFGNQAIGQRGPGSHQISGLLPQGGWLLAEPLDLNLSVSQLTGGGAQTQAGAPGCCATLLNTHGSSLAVKTNCG
jgi:hypothetical protein